jgi:hypothetical protein
MFKWDRRQKTKAFPVVSVSVHYSGWTLPFTPTPPKIFSHVWRVWVDADGGGKMEGEELQVQPVESEKRENFWS